MWILCTCGCSHCIHVYWLYCFATEMNVYRLLCLSAEKLLYIITPISVIKVTNIFFTSGRIDLFLVHEIRNTFSSSCFPFVGMRIVSCHNPPILAAVFLIFCNLRASLHQIFSKISCLSFLPCIQPISSGCQLNKPSLRYFLLLSALFNWFFFKQNTNLGLLSEPLAWETT